MFRHPQVCGGSFLRILMKMRERREKMRQEDEKQTEFKLAELPECCQEKLTEFERELNSMGYWNIALVAYQKE